MIYAKPCNLLENCSFVHFLVDIRLLACEINIINVKVIHMKDSGNNENKINESDFHTEDIQKEKNDNAEKTKKFPKKALLFPIILIPIILISISLNREKDFDFSLLGDKGEAKVEENKIADKPNIYLPVSSPHTPEGEPQKLKKEELLVEQSNNDGIKINGRHDVIARMLLANYPTHEEMRAELERTKQERINGDKDRNNAREKSLLSVKSNTDEISELRNLIKNYNTSDGGNGEALALVSEIRATLAAQQEAYAAQTQKLESLQKVLGELKRNSGWYHNRITKLEINGIVAKGAGVSTNSKSTEVRRLKLESQPSWFVNGASGNLAFIKNKHTGKSLRITRGFNIPGCGQVTDIDPAAQKVVTTSCVIRNL